ncbi:deoxyguanosine kinase/deoxyadenosine kinase [Fibrobacterales bacterium]|nr:deoxyguanosine kinase/deoxyadenosine kinase [Fibrobacterales bacterium]
MSQNTTNPVFVAVEGPIGVGKSALIDALEKEYGKNGIRTFKEELELDRTQLDRFYGDKKKFAFQTQIAFLLSRYKQYEDMQKILKQPEMFPADLLSAPNSNPKLFVTDFIFEKNDIFAELTIEDEQEWKLYQKMREVLGESAKNFAKPNLIVYLRAGEETLYRRIQNRHQQTIQLNLQSGICDGFKGITHEYLKQLAALYDRYFFHYKTSQILIIDVNNTDFVHTEHAAVSPISVIIDAIKKAIDSPLGQNTYIKLDEK